MSRRLGAVGLAAALALVLTSCNVPERGAMPLAPPASTSASEPSPSASRSPPVAASPTQKPVIPVVPANLPRQAGTGPGGSMKATGNSSVALTFDDGPDAVYTPKMLDTLKRQGVKATFCVLGKQAKAHPGLVRRILAEGHTICNHSWAHSMVLRKQPTEDIVKDLTDTNDAIRRAAPKAKIKYFRAPGGYFDARLVKIAASLGLRSLHWSVDTRDWEFSVYGRGTSMASHIVACIQTRTRRGSIILAHDSRKPDTIAAIATVLPWLKRNVTLVALPT